MYCKAITRLATAVQQPDQIFTVKPRCISQKEKKKKVFFGLISFYTTKSKSLCQSLFCCCCSCEPVKAGVPLPQECQVCTTLKKNKQSEKKNPNQKLEVQFRTKFCIFYITSTIYITCRLKTTMQVELNSWKPRPERVVP